MGVGHQLSMLVAVGHPMLAPLSEASNRHNSPNTHINTCVYLCQACAGPPFPVSIAIRAARLAMRLAARALARATSGGITCGVFTLPWPRRWRLGLGTPQPSIVVVHGTTIPNGPMRPAYLSVRSSASLIASGITTGLWLAMGGLQWVEDASNGLIVTNLWQLWHGCQ